MLQSRRLQDTHPAVPSAAHRVQHDGNVVGARQGNDLDHRCRPFAARRRGGGGGPAVAQLREDGGLGSAVHVVRTWQVASNTSGQMVMSLSACEQSTVPKALQRHMTLCKPTVSRYAANRCSPQPVHLIIAVSHLKQARERPAVWVRQVSHWRNLGPQRVGLHSTVELHGRAPTGVSSAATTAAGTQPRQIRRP